MVSLVVNIIGLVAITAILTFQIRIKRLHDQYFKYNKECFDALFFAISALEVRIGMLEHEVYK